MLKQERQSEPVRGAGASTAELCEACGAGRRTELILNKKSIYIVFQWTVYL
jgi:hypothetical protein